MGGTPKILKIIGVLAGIALGFVFLIAALLKAADPTLFAEQIAGYKMLPESLCQPAAYFLIVFELILGALLILWVMPRVSLLFALAILFAFVGATLWAWSQGNAESCGCFGRAGGRGPMAVVLEDTIFIALAFLAFAVSRWNPRARPRWIAFFVLLPLLLAVPFVAPTAPVDAWVTPVRPGADLKDLAVDGMRVPLGEGWVLLGMLGKECEECDASIPVLDEAAQLGEGLQVAAVFAGTSREARAFSLEHVPAFPVGHSPVKVLRQYYRRLPVFILMRDGVVRKAWWSEAPSRESVLEGMRHG